MNMSSHKTLSAIKVTILTLILAVGAQYAVAQWSSAPANPPSNNVGAPINVTDTPQDKKGALHVNTNSTDPNTVGFITFGQSWFYGNVGIGTNAPTAPLTIKPTTDNEDKIVWYNDGASFKGALAKTPGDVGNIYVKGPTSFKIKTSPTYGGTLVDTLTVDGSNNKVIVPSLQITGGAPGANKVLTSDASGNSTWQAAGGAPAFSRIYCSSTPRTAAAFSTDFVTPAITTPATIGEFATCPAGTSLVTHALIQVANHVTNNNSMDYSEFIKANYSTNTIQCVVSSYTGIGYAVGSGLCMPN